MAQPEIYIGKLKSLTSTTVKVLMCVVKWSIKKIWNVILDSAIGAGIAGIVMLAANVGWLKDPIHSIVRLIGF